MATATAIPTGLRERLIAVVGRDHVRTDEGALVTFSTDATPLERGRPDAVVFAATAEEVASVLRLANASGIPVVPRGSGTNLSAGTVPHRGGIVLVLTRMNKVKEISDSDLVAVCEPGVRTIELSQAAAAKGLLYPPDPGSQTTATIGGNVAECAGGLRALKYGVTRDYVLGVEAVLPTGEIIRSGGRLVKDVAGYDLRRLLCGSEGTLAVMTELTLRLVPAPEASGYGMAYFPELADAARAVSRVLASGVLPVTLEFLDQVCIGAVEDYAKIGLDTSAGALLIFGQDGNAAVIARDLERMGQACRTEGAISLRIAESPEEASEVLEARRAALPSLSRLEPLTLLEDATVPRSRIAEMVEYIQEVARRYELKIGTFGHAGDGNLHPTAVLDHADEDAVRRARAAFDEIFARALELDGTITGEHGIGIVKLRYLERQLGADHMALLRRIKAAFDPNGILNPGKLGS
ncbi:FAD-binding protein [Solirubrobacter ginsenosidimutans]|uniref:FAD-binding protein n=1 Tax=Solirubrobacter ginsenosidimutans TaxID=490573 RepID=A0A9X3N521_9ACTN|nr:FAD-linked oxidase C-terminal domain-containing protein [Solirubrobacter ginsenosidimutans]MDA0164978.1 FAD-binding protein [Solirubrobacter ginsenosidimutans]